MGKLTNSYNLKKINPKLAKEWHPTKNGNLTPKDVLPKSGKKVWWRCTNDHDRHASIISRARGKGCPSCPIKTAPAEYNLQVVNPKLAKEWHPVKNGDLTPKDVFPGSHKKVWWLCEKGHAWKAFVFSRKRGSGCPHCNRQERSLAYYHSIETGIKNNFFNL